MWHEQAAKLITKRRMALGLSLADAGQRAGVSQACWESWERGDVSELSWESFELAAQALGSQVEITLTDEASAYMTAFREGGMDRELRLVTVAKELAQEVVFLNRECERLGKSVEPSEN